MGWLLLHYFLYFSAYKHSRQYLVTLCYARHTVDYSGNFLTDGSSAVQKLHRGRINEGPV